MGTHNDFAPFGALVFRFAGSQGVALGFHILCLWHGIRGFSMNVIVRVLSMIVAMFPILSGSAQDSTRITLDSRTHQKCLNVLRTGLRSAEFWPSMHAAEGLTLGGHGLEVIEYLTPKLETETDDQHLCGIAREIVRAGDRSVVPVMRDILEGNNSYGHVHAAGAPAERQYQVETDGCRSTGAMRRCRDTADRTRFTR